MNKKRCRGCDQHATVLVDGYCSTCRHNQRLDEAENLDADDFPNEQDDDE